MNAPTRPLMRYHGGKWMLAPWIIQHMPAHRIYVEPYGGGASVLLRKPRAYAEVYNDLDNEIVSLFQVVRDHGQELVRALELTPFAREELELSYEDSQTPLEQARRTVVRSFLGHGSNSMKLTKTGRRERMGFRCDSNRSGSTPAADWRNYPHGLGAIIARMQGVVIENVPALDLMTDHDREDALFYVDPPYMAETRNAGHDYRHELTEFDHEVLLGRLRTLKGHVMVSGYFSELYADVLSDWRLLKKEHFADGARPRTECLWLSPSITDHRLL